MPASTFRSSLLLDFCFKLFLVLTLYCNISCVFSGERPIIQQLDSNPIPSLSRFGNSNDFLPTKCESCILFSRELESATSRLPLKQPADEAEGWLVDELEVICKRMLDYRLHREHEGLARFSKEPTQIAKLARNMASKGVEVKLDVPTNLLNEPTIESDYLRRHCESFLEDFETEIERWFFERRNDYSLVRYLCGGNNFAKNVDSSCKELAKSSSIKRRKGDNESDKKNLKSRIEL